MPLFTLGSLVLDVPMGIVGVDYVTGSDFAVKPIVGAAQPREFMGEADSHLSFSLQLFPHAAARNDLDMGIDTLNALEQMARSGQPYFLMRVGPPGVALGYWLFDSDGFSKRGTKHDQFGNPRMIEVQLKLTKSPERSSLEQGLLVLTGFVNALANSAGNVVGNAVSGIGN